MLKDKEKTTKNQYENVEKEINEKTNEVEVNYDDKEGFQDNETGNGFGFGMFLGIIFGVALGKIILDNIKKAEELLMKLKQDTCILN